MKAAETTLASFLYQLAAKAAVPGGGSVAALVGALAAALESMVANYTVGKLATPEQEAQVQELLARCESLRGQLADLVQADMDAYQQVAAARRLPRETPQQQEQRAAAVQAALKEACGVPLRTAQACHQVLAASGRLLEQGNPRLASDTGIAALLAEAGFLAAWLNVEVNLAAIQEAGFKTQVRRVIQPLLAQVPGMRQDVWSQVLKRCQQASAG